MLQPGGQGCRRRIDLISTSIRKQQKTTPKVQINSATLQVMGQTAKDCGYTKEEFIEAVEMYEHFGNIDLEDVPTPSPQD